MRMAGQGGGPPRKSHTKSRKGCKTCKKRHIRCDETFPQCRNCTKHNCRCDYMDQPAAGEEPLKGSAPPDLMMGPELQATLDQWRITGECPIAELRTASPNYWMRFSTIDLRLIHHIANLSIDLQSRGYAQCTSWAPKMPILIAVGMQSDFVMSAVLAFSASHLAWQTKHEETENLAYYHRGIALKGLHEAIGAFSRENSESILAASILLSWQATEWRSWASLQQGVSTVMNAMRPWLHESELAIYLERQRSIGRARTPITPAYPGHQLPALPEDLNRLHQAVQGLSDLRLRLANNHELLGYVDELIAYVHQIQQDFPIQAPDTAFTRLQTMRSWLFWLPPQLLRPDASDVGAVAVMSHFYATALALEPLFPEIGGAYFGSLSITPIEQMHQMLLSRRSSHPQETGLQVALDLMLGPVHTAASYNSRTPQPAMAQAIGDPRAFRQSSHSPYMIPQAVHTPTSEVSSSTMYTSSPVHSPGSLRVPVSPYFPPIPSQSGPALARSDSDLSRPSLMGTQHSSRSTGSTLSQGSSAGGQYAPTAPEHHGYGFPAAMGYHDSAGYAPITYGMPLPLDNNREREGSGGSAPGPPGAQDGKGKGKGWQH